MRDNGDSLKEILNAILTKKTWAIFVHERPDGDAIGSGSAFYSWGMALGKRCIWGGTHPMPKAYGYLPFVEEYQVMNFVPDVVREPDTAIIVLDTSNLERTVQGILDLYDSTLIVNIDHHMDNQRFGRLNYIDTSSSATAEIIWDLLNDSKLPIPKDARIGIYTGIITDTGHFTYSNTTPKSHLIAQDVLSSGINPEQIFRYIYASRRLEGLKLWGLAFMRAFSTPDGKAVVSWLKKEDFEKLNADPYDSEGIVNQLLYVKGAIISALMTEGEDGEVRVSFRAVTSVSVRELAQKWDGGGHPQAAACKIYLPIEKALDVVSKSIEEYVKNV
ncbi:DHH family phosphoesterase [Acetomicrobium sp. UBA5826]|uniref:DHH family phosphoesterase n=1 Tax=Acetomicrobium sp. UBA5826 TaxID=1946039 RepID=UPI002580A711|nr:bifunctional oligoribonuclease/PAP phosphatase NrnA [Acetomicrobium sp. UBA5826]